MNTCTKIKFDNFQMTDHQVISEIHCTLTEFVHLPTGARVMHIANDDPENLFCLSFKTYPESSNGVAHILEHTVLCGSKKFPVKDPFFAMTRRSLNTFMNALTGSDFTCYPAATQVKQDFYNLLEVYLDAVFNPNLNEYSFLQEGHRLEFAKPTDPSTPLVHKGIVFNEMKGSLSSPNARLIEALTHELYPDITYGYNSGGDPKEIPHLTYQELLAFHQTYYHPSRCLFFFYGNLPIEEHLQFIAEHALKEVQPATPLPVIPPQPRFLEPKRLLLTYPIPEEEELKDKTLIGFGWLTTPLLNQKEVLALSLLTMVLLDTDASPLKLMLLKSGLCKQVSASIDTDISEVPIMIFLRGGNSEHVDELEKILRESLQEIVASGISMDLVKNAMHQLELARSEISGNHTPFGLSLFFRSGLLKQHGVNPEEGLKIHSLFDQLHEELHRNPQYFVELIQQYLLDNPHFVRIAMQPNKELAAKEIADELKELEDIRSQLAPGQVNQIIEKSLGLAAFQKSQEEVSEDVLPKIMLKDVPEKVREYSIKKEKIGEINTFHHECFTNQILYVDLVFDLPKIEPEDLPYVRLLTVLLPQLGSGGRTYAEQLDYLQAHTGGIGAGLGLNIQAKDQSLFFPTISLRGKALYREADPFFSILNDLTKDVDFADHDRIKEVLLKHDISLHSTISQNALKYAMNLSANSLSSASTLAYKWYGLEYYWMIHRLVENIDDNLTQVISTLQRLHESLLKSLKPDLVITCSKPMYDELKQKEFYGLNSSISNREQEPWVVNYPLEVNYSQGRVIASPVAFTSHVFQTVEYVHQDAPALTIAACLFENLILHKRIREQGGAYGGGASSNALAGSFTFYAYRDPNLSLTLEAFEEAAQEIAEGNFELSDLEEAKLEIIQAMDAPVALGSRGELTYTHLREGKTAEVRQNFRLTLLKLEKEDVIHAVKKHIIQNLKTGAVVVFAGKELLERENALLASKKMPTFPIEYI